MHPSVELRPLTTLRFAAAIWVALFSFWPHLDTSLKPLFITKGYLGVELFFVLSGFIISHVYLERFGEKQFSYRAFIWARLARIYPLHLATLFGVMALGLTATAAGIGISGNVLHWPSLPANLLMVQAWGFASTAGWNHPSWSVSAEWFAYLAFPAFAFVAWKLKDRPIVAVASAAALLISLYQLFPLLTGHPLTQATYHWGALRIVPAFAYGCALYLAFRKVPLKRPLLSLLAALAMFWLCAAQLGSDILIVVSCGSLIVSLASLGNDRAGPLSSRIATWLGEISYSIYMCCAPWLMISTNVIGKLTNNPDKQFNILIWLVIIAGLIGVAAILHHLVERPARAYLRKKGPQQPT